MRSGSPFPARRRKPRRRVRDHGRRVILERLFSGAAALPCPDAADVDDDGALALTDALRALVYLRGSALPPGGPHARPPRPPRECALVMDCQAYKKR